MAQEASPRQSFSSSKILLPQFVLDPSGQLWELMTLAETTIISDRGWIQKDNEA